MRPAFSSHFFRLILIGGFACAANVASHAAVVVTLDNPVTLSPGSPSANYVSFNLATGVFTSNAIAADGQFLLDYFLADMNKARLGGIGGRQASVLFVVVTNDNSTNRVVNNPQGSLISSASAIPPSAFGTNAPFLSYDQDATSQFRKGMLGYAGLRITDPSNPNQLDYGYAAITLNPDNSVTISRLAYENTGAPIAAGAVPEPSTLATSLLGLGGAVGAMVARRRRAAKNALA